MRDLRQDLEDYHRYMAERSLKVIDLMINSLPHAIDRALRGENFIKGLSKELADAQDQKSRAEAEMERYKLMVKSITGGLDEAIETIHYLETENALLRKVEEVGEIMWGDAICHRCESQVCRGCTAHDFKKAMSEYQSWKEGQK